MKSYTISERVSLWIVTARDWESSRHTHGFTDAKFRQIRLSTCENSSLPNFAVSTPNYQRNFVWNADIPLNFQLGVVIIRDKKSAKFQQNFRGYKIRVCLHYFCSALYGRVCNKNICAPIFVLIITCARNIFRRITFEASVTTALTFQYAAFSFGVGMFWAWKTLTRGRPLFVRSPHAS